MSKDAATNFDAELFKKRVRQGDSDQADGGVALTQAAKQCRERTPPLLFHEAVIKHMRIPMPSMDEVAEEAERLGAENQLLRNENVELKQQVDQLKAMQKDEVSMDGEHDFGELVERVCGSPQGLIVIFLTLFVGRLGIYLEWETTVQVVRFWAWNALFFIPAAIVLLDWIELQFKRSGLVVLLMKASMVCIGLLIAYNDLFMRLPWNDGVPIAHLPSGLTRNPAWAFGIVTITAIVTCSRLAKFLVALFRAFVLPTKPMKVLRGIF